MELETRHCKCGCGLTWRCLPTSKNYYAVESHDPDRPVPVVSLKKYREVQRWLTSVYGEDKPKDK